jgi:hypothetical protein
MPYEEFDVLGEEDLTLPSTRFERMYTNRKNARRSSGMCYRCGKHELFIAECPEAMEVKHEHKHRPRTDHNHHSRDNHKGKNKSERRPRKCGGHKKKERAMVARASDIDSSSFYPSSSLENWHKGKQSSKNINGFCFVVQGFCGMAQSSASKKSNKDDSDSNFEDEVGRLEGFWLIDSSFSRRMIGDRRSLLGTMGKAGSSIFFRVSQLLDEGFEVRFKTGASRVLDSRGDLVRTIISEGQIFRANFS